MVGAVSRAAVTPPRSGVDALKRCCSLEVELPVWKLRSPAAFCAAVG